MSHGLDPRDCQKVSMPFIEDVKMVPTLGRWTCGWRAQHSEQTSARTAKGVSQVVEVEVEVVMAEQVPDSDGRCCICTEQRERGQHVGPVEAAGPAPEPGLTHHRPGVDTKVDSPWRFVSSPKPKGSASLGIWGQTVVCIQVLRGALKVCIWDNVRYVKRAAVAEECQVMPSFAAAHARRAEVLRRPSRRISSANVNRQ